MSKEQMRVGDFITPSGLIYTEFKNKKDWGNKFFGLFRQMAREMEETNVLRPRDTECMVKFLDETFYLTLRINERGTNYADDYKPVPGPEAFSTLKNLAEKRLTPIWIEIRNDWFNIRFSSGKTKYRVNMIKTTP